jgi:hypothetical protein
VASAPFDAPLLEVGERLDDLRQFLAYLDTPRKHSRAAQLSRTSRAWAYVAMGAAFEDFIKSFIDELSLHINSAQVPLGHLKLGVVSVVEAPSFASLEASSKQVIWDRRAKILAASASQSVAQLTVGLHPIDGRTIRAEHLKTLWQIYDLPGTPLPGPIHSLALEDLRKGRNAVAHGNDDPVAFGGSRAYPDVVKRIGHIEDVAVHVASAGASYVAARGFVR